MMLLVWKRKNNGYIIPQNQIKGIIALCLVMAVMPFFYSLIHVYFNYKLPDYSEHSDNSVAVEIVKDDQAQGIYFFESRTSVNKLLKTANFRSASDKDFYLSNGMKINIYSKSNDKKITVSEMDAAKRLALGMSLDINKASKDELILINGIGEKTATNIIELREKKGQFKKIEELTKIRGIKEKRLSAFRKNLYVGETSE
jgi:competence protein ComEA